MKKNLILLASATMALASCSNDVLLDNDVAGRFEANEIDFDIEVLNATRTSYAAGTTFVTGDQLKVNGFEYETGRTNENQLFINQKVEKTSTDWTYMPKKYWEDSRIYDFYASFPYGESKIAFDPATKMYKVSDFTLASQDNRTQDLMIASKVVDAAHHQKVNLLFHHILSNVNFQAKIASGVVANGAKAVKILSFDISNVLANGSYAQSAWTDNYAVGAWTHTGTPAIYDFPTLADISLDTDETTTTELYTDYLAMPQKLFSAPGVGTKDVDIQVEFEVTYTDDTKQTFERELRLSSVKATSKDGAATTDIISEWLPDYKYTYTLAFNPAKTTLVWPADHNGGKTFQDATGAEQDPAATATDEEKKAAEKQESARYNIDNPDVIEIGQDTNGDGKLDNNDTWTEYPIIWEDIDGDGLLEAGIDKDNDGKIDNVDGDNTTKWPGDVHKDPTDGNSSNTGGADAILVQHDSNHNGYIDPEDEWCQLEKNPETGEIGPKKETTDDVIEFTAEVAPWAHEYEIDYEITK